jgi:two-component system, sensor histidine kinase
MAEAEDSASGALKNLAQFEASNTADGRHLHYAKGRIRSFWLRQTLTLFGSVTIGLLASPWLGMALAAIALGGEAIDIATLRQVIRRLRGGKSGPLTTSLTLASAILQSLTIGACVALCWQVVPVNEARFFAASFLISAAINAGLGRPHFRPAADARLVVFLLTGFVMMAIDLRQPAFATSLGYAYFAASFLLLAYISLLFIRLLERNYEQRRRHELTLLSQQQDQEIARAALATSVKNSQRLALVAKYANDSIVLSGPDGRIEWVNDAFTRITGYEFDDATGRFPAEILNAAGTDMATVHKLNVARDTCSPVRVEILNRTKSGRLIWMETSIIPITGEDGQLQVWIAVEREITEAKEREAELARARIAAEEAGQSKSRFLANMSHEIRTPMNGVIGVAELLSETDLTASQANFVETILESGKALLGIINDILDLAKLQSGKAMLVAEPFSPKGCIDSVLRILGPSADKKGLHLRLEGEVSDAFVLGDEGKIRQILLNLVGNAVKFTREGTVSVALHLPTDHSGLLEIVVTDTGIGIAQDRIDAIFESFSQADNGIGRQFGGTGLGLTICAMLAEQMGGSITAESVIGRGSVFTLRARLPLTSPSKSPVKLVERRALPRLRPGLVVMVAEDNRTNMMIARKMLEGHVHTLIEATNGDEVLALYTERQPDLILMDISMPIKDGLQATREIRAHEGRLGLVHCPILALTANAFGEDREACRDAGLDGFLVKPLSRADLLSAIDVQCPSHPPHGRAIGL